ncbi:hypothetical protein V6N11_054845 [Hibiscus sabdariffa]|uniref:Wall-associated receptor kinase galacturonan-binding domain-containing protein n=1 Tax=Hibiscus sabdariffa TaxID=183260 RepID=A0ABR2NBC4_9ROSI
MIVRYALNLSLLLLVTTGLASAANSTAKPGCMESCGEVRIPYPFGIGPNCSLNSWFEVSCNETSTPPTTLLDKINMEVLNFSLRSSDYDPDLEYHRVKAPAVYANCSGREDSHGVNLRASPFFFSEFRNRIVVCTGGAVFALNLSNNCYDGTCCVTVITSAIKTFNATFGNIPDGCNSAYLVEQNWRESNTANRAVGAVLDWAIPEEGFELSKSGKEYRCRQYGLIFDEPHLDRSIRCYCNTGYQGNAYLLNGSQEVRANILKRGPWVFDKDWLVGHLVASCPKQPYSPSAKFQYGDWLRAPLKKKEAFSAISKGRIYFHEEDDSSNSQSEFSTIGDDSFLGTGPVTFPSGFGNVVPLRAPVTAPRSPVHAAPLPGHAKAAPATTEEIAADAGINGADATGLHGLSEVFFVDVSGHVHVSENALLGDEAGVFAASVSHAVAAPVTLAPSFDAIEEWLADDGESEVPGEEAPPIQLPTKRSSDGSDPSRVK